MSSTVKINEIVYIRNSKNTARVIEIYTVPEESERLFLIKLLNGEKIYVFESQTTHLQNLDPLLIQ